MFVLILMEVALAYRFAWRPDTKVFPYEQVPPPSIIDNGDNDGGLVEDRIGRTKLESIEQKCIAAWQGDGKCNSDNNKEDCDFDAGDCCGFSCMRNCQEIDEDGNDIRHLFLALKKDERPCPFECGVVDYACLAEDQGCYACNLSNAVCTSQEKCFEDNDREALLNMLDTCQALNWSMGNERTINQYCGQDPDYEVVHDINDRRLHFPGCGILKDQCTARPCCTDALKYGFNSTTCNDIIAEYEFFDPAIFAFTKKRTTCLRHMKECFQANY